MQKCGRPLHRISSNKGGWWHWQAECEGKPLETPPLAFQALVWGWWQADCKGKPSACVSSDGWRLVGGGRQSVRVNPSTHISSDGGRWWQAECKGKPLHSCFEQEGGGGWQSARENPLLAFRVTEEGGGRQSARENPSTCVSSNGGGWWQAECKGKPSTCVRETEGGWWGWWQAECEGYSAHVSSDGGGLVQAE